MPESPRTATTWSTRIGIGLLSLVLLLGLYVAVYWLVIDGSPRAAFYGMACTPEIRLIPVYKKTGIGILDGGLLEQFFTPVFAIDRRIRPRYWVDPPDDEFDYVSRERRK